MPIYQILNPGGQAQRSPVYESDDDNLILHLAPHSKVSLRLKILIIPLITLIHLYWPMTML